MIYRSYRYPYEYVPQVEKPVEVPVAKVDNMTFRMPGAASCELQNVTEVPEALGYSSKIAACVTEETVEEDDDEVGAKF